MHHLRQREAAIRKDKPSKGSTLGQSPAQRRVDAGAQKANPYQFSLTGNYLIGLKLQG